MAKSNPSARRKAVTSRRKAALKELVSELLERDDLFQSLFLFLLAARNILIAGQVGACAGTRGGSIGRSNYSLLNLVDLHRRRRDHIVRRRICSRRNRLQLVRIRRSAGFQF